MYTNNAYLNDSHIDRKDKSNPLIVTMCGTYKLYTKPKLPTWRPRGRVDFQLLYVASGKAHFYFDKDGTDTIVHAGHMVLYRPKEPQKYVYYAKDHTEVYWVHFTGSSVTNLLRSYGITKDKRVFYCGSDPEYKNLFSVMIKELQMCKSGYSEMLEMYLSIMLCAHNTTFFKPLQVIEAGDIITFKTSYGVYQYQVSRTDVKDHNDSTAYDLLQEKEELVMYTCYPFETMVGTKTDRFFVYCEKISGPTVID